VACLGSEQNSSNTVCTSESYNSASNLYFMTLILYLLQISPKTTNSAITKRAPKRDTPLLNT